MAEQKSIKLNMVMNAILTMSQFIFPIITFPYVSRILLPAGTGRINFAASAVSYFAMFAQLGIPTYGVRACAKVRDDKAKLSKTVHELMMINIIMCVMVYIVFIASIFVVPRFNRDWKLFLITGITIGLNALGVEWLYRALEKYTYITVRSVIFKAVGIVAMFMFVHKQEDYLIYGAITVFAGAASNILNFINLRKYVSFGWLGNYQLKNYIKPVLIFFMMSVATTIYTNLDNVMLGFMKDDEAVGYYGAAVKIKNILVSLVTSASAVLLPRASYYVDKGLMEDFERILKKTMHLILLIAVPMMIYFMIYAAEGIYFLSGKEYGGSIVPMIIIMPTLTLIGMTNVIGIQMLIPLGKEKEVLYSEIAGAIVDLILNAILIPRFAASGAAIGTLVAECVVLIYQLMSIKWEKIKLYYDIEWTKILVANTISIFACIWVKLIVFFDKLTLNSFVRIIISGICFFGVYGIGMLVMKETLVKELVDQIIGKFKSHKMHK